VLTNNLGPFAVEISCLTYSNVVIRLVVFPFQPLRPTLVDLQIAQKRAYSPEPNSFFLLSFFSSASAPPLCEAPLSMPAKSERISLLTTSLCSPPPEWTRFPFVCHSRLEFPPFIACDSLEVRPLMKVDPGCRSALSPHRSGFLTAAE